MDNTMKKNVFDSKEILLKKGEKIATFIEVEKSNLITEEVRFINTIVKNLSSTLHTEEFSGKKGTYLYTFQHKNTDREVYISPDVYLIDADCVIFEVLNPKKYSEVSPNEILISAFGKYFCEIQLTDFLEFVSPEDIYKGLDKYINEDYDELEKLQKREEFLNSFRIRH